VHLLCDQATRSKQITDWTQAESPKTTEELEKYGSGDTIQKYFTHHCKNTAYHLSSKKGNKKETETEK